MTRPRAFFVIGPAGSGKSSVAQAIAARTHAAYLDKDSVAGPLVELLLTERGDSPWERDENAFYQEQIFPLEYDTVMRVAGDNLRLGTSVVIDAPFRRYTPDPGWLAASRSRLAWPDVEALVVHVTVAEDVLRRRLIARANDRDRWKLANWEAFWTHARRSRCAWTGATHVDVPNDGNAVDLTPIAGYLA